MTPSTQLLGHYASVCGGDYAYLELMLREVLAAGERQRRTQRAWERGEPAPQNDAHSLYDSPEPFRLYSIDVIESHTTYDGHGIPTELRLILTIRAKVEGLDRYYFGIGCHGDYRRGAVSLEAGFGCSIGEFTESDKGVHNGYFQLDRELSPEDAEPFTFLIRVVYHTHVRADWPIISQPKTDTVRYVLSAQFTAPSLPKRVWWFDAATAVEAENDPADKQVLPRTSSGFYRHVFTSLALWRTYGLNGEWE